MKIRLIFPVLVTLLLLALFVTGSAFSQGMAPSVELLKPQNIACQGWERDTVVVSWKDVSTDETGYKIERSDGGGAWNQIATVMPNADGNYAAYRDTGVDVSTQSHRYRVRSYEGTNNSPYSDVCNNRRIYDPQNFRIFYGLRSTSDDCPLIDGNQVCLTNTTGGSSGNTFVDLQYNALQGSADSFFRLGFANRADQPFGSLDKIPINVVWCDGGGCAGGGGIGLSPLLMETSFNLSTRAGDPIAYMVALHELWHFLQGKYYYLNDPNDRWVIEGQARSVQDKICIGGNRPTALCFDDIATGYAGYVPEVNGYLSNTNRPIGTTSYQAVLFWTYLTEKYGTSAPSDQVEAGMNFMVEFWEASENNHGLSGIATINKALESLGHSERFRDIWKDFAVSNYAKDYSGPAKYRYADMGQTGGSYNPVALSVDEALSLNESYLDTDETVLNWGARYYQFRPDSNVPFVDIRVTQDSPSNLYYTVLGIRGSNIVYEHNIESRHLNLSLLNDNYDKVTVIVAGLENLGNYRISINGTSPTLLILKPTTATKARVGSMTSPDKFLVQVEVVDDSGAPMAGVNLASFSFQVGDVAVPAGNVLSSYILMGQEWFVLRAPAQTSPDPDGSPNTYDLTVNYGAALSDTQDDAVDYTPRTDADSVILLDKSGSMLGDKLTNAKNAAKLFVDSWRVGDKIGLISFNSAVSVDMQLTNWTDTPSGGSRQDIFDEIDALSAGGGTRIGDTLLAGYSELQARGDNSHDWALVLLSDGDETDPGTRTFDQAVDDIVNATGKKPVIHTVAVGPDADRPRMQAAATRTGGTYQYVSIPMPIVTQNGTYQIDDMALAMDYRYRTIATDVLGHQQFYSYVREFGPPGQDVLNINVESGAAELVLALSWNGLMGDVWLRDPNSTIVSPFQSTFRHRVWRVPTPMGGTWTLELNQYIIPRGETEPGATPDQLPDYLVQASIKTDVTMDIFLTTPVEDRVPGHPVTIAASLTDNAPITGALVLASVEKPDGTVYSFWMWDDGAHEDGAAGDGLYGGTFYQTGQQGSYNVTIYALGFSPSLGETFYREKALSFHMARVDGSGNEIPDLDTDGDGLPDGWEIFFQPCTNPLVSDAGADPDGDGANNATEWQNGTDPCDPDTDDDGQADGTDTNPVDPDPEVITTPEAHAFPGVGQVFIRYSGDPAYQAVGLFRDEDDDMDEFFTIHLVDQVGVGTGLDGVFTDTLVMNDHEYCYIVAAIDTGGLRSTFSAPTCAVPRTDPLGPHGSVQINNGAAVTLIQDVSLNLWASDSVDPEVDDFGPQFPPPADSASGVSDMLISNAPDFSGAAWEPYATSKPWTLAQDSGLASVYVRYRDAVGNESDTYVATIWVGSGPGLIPVYLPVLRK